MLVEPKPFQDQPGNAKSMFAMGADNAKEAMAAFAAVPKTAADAAFYSKAD